MKPSRFRSFSFPVLGFRSSSVFRSLGFAFVLSPVTFVLSGSFCSIGLLFSSSCHSHHPFPFSEILSEAIALFPSFFFPRVPYQNPPSSPFPNPLALTHETKHHITSHNSTPNPIHSPLHIRPHKIPIRPTLRKLINLLRRENTPIPLSIRENSREFLCLQTRGAGFT